MEENMKYYELMRQCPQHALKTIKAGRLQGMSDVNPMWRIKIMTQTFGMCGFGWKYEVLNQWTETCGQEVKAFCNINLYVKVNGEWSEPIFGTGGSSLVAVESRGLYVSDECHKMALTDALSVAMKALGVGADVYFGADAKFDTKYDQDQYVAEQNKAPKQVDDTLRKLISECTSSEAVGAIWKAHKELQTNAEFKQLITEKGGELKEKETRA